MNGLTLMNTLTMVYSHLLTNDASPWGRVTGLFQWGSSGIKTVSTAIAVFGLCACGIMFMLSDRLSEKAKPWLWRIAIGLLIVGCSGVITSAIKGVAGY